MDVYASVILESVPDGIILATGDGTVLATNAAARSMLGRTEAEIKKAGRTGLLVMNDAAYRFIEARRVAGHARGVLTMKRKDGTMFFADVASTVFAGPGASQWMTVCLRDVTEAHRARRVLQVLADAGRILALAGLDLAATLEALTSLVVPVLADVCTVDLMYEDGVSRAAVAHRDPSQVDRFKQVRRRQVNPDADAGADFVMRTGKASYVTVLDDAWLRATTLDERHFREALALGVQSFVSVPLVVEGRTTGALTLMSDGQAPSFTEDDLPLFRALGDVAAMSLENARRHAEVVDARRLRDEVLAIVAHDLRGPLGVIKLANEALARVNASPETETITRALRRANTLVHDLLLASKAEASTLPLDRKIEGMASIVDEVHALFAPLALAREVAFEIHVDGDHELALAVVDRHRVIQMLSNVVANAIEMTRAGGRVELRVKGDATTVAFAVTDTGPGIAPDDLPRIFDRFWQSAKRRKAGAGLGLTIARAIALSHGGELTAESQLGKGTTFHIVLPRQPPT